MSSLVTMTPPNQQRPLPVFKTGACSVITAQKMADGTIPHSPQASVIRFQESMEKKNSVHSQGSPSFINPLYHSVWAFEKYHHSVQTPCTLNGAFEARVYQ